MADVKKLMTDWLIFKEQEKVANEKRAKVEIELYKEVMQQIEIKKEGTTHFECDGVKLTLESKMSVSVDQEKAAEHPELFNCKYEFSKTKNKALSPSQVRLQEEMIVIKPSKPTFKVTVL
jgi:hypothetical protein